MCVCDMCVYTYKGSLAVLTYNGEGGMPLSYTRGYHLKTSVQACVTSCPAVGQQGSIGPPKCYHCYHCSWFPSGTRVIGHGDFSHTYLCMTCGPVTVIYLVIFFLEF